MENLYSVSLVELLIFPSRALISPIWPMKEPCAHLGRFDFTRLKLIILWQNKLRTASWVAVVLLSSRNFEYADFQDVCVSFRKVTIIQGLRLEHREAQLRSTLIDVEDFEGDYSIAMAW